MLGCDDSVLGLRSAGKSSFLKAHEYQHHSDNGPEQDSDDGGESITSQLMLDEIS